MTACKTGFPEEEQIAGETLNMDLPGGVEVKQHQVPASTPAVLVPADLQEFNLAFPSSSTKLPPTMINVTPNQLRQAADIKERIDLLQNELNQILGSAAPAPAQDEAPQERTFSAANRAPMKAAQKARWAAIKGTSPAAEPVKPFKKAKRKLSAQGLANIRAGVAKRMAAQGNLPAAKPAKKGKMSAAQKAALSVAAKARWAKAKAAGRSKL